MCYKNTFLRCMFAVPDQYNLVIQAVMRLYLELLSIFWFGKTQKNKNSTTNRQDLILKCISSYCAVVRTYNLKRLYLACEPSSVNHHDCEMEWERVFWILEILVDEVNWGHERIWKGFAVSHQKHLETFKLQYIHTSPKVALALVFALLA